MTAGHHLRCPVRWGDRCSCSVQWAADEADDDDDPYGLACAYGRFYDPDFDSDPWAPPEPYGGWSRTLRGEVGRT